MSIEAHLANLRSKPEHTRKQFAFWSSFVLTTIIASFWLASFTGHLNTASVQSDVSATLSKINTPAQSLVASVGTFIVDIKEMIFGAKKIVYPSVEVVGGVK